MNLLFAADVSIARVIGGAERVLYEESTELARRNHGVHVLTRRLPGHEADDEVIDGVREWRYGIQSGSGSSSLRSALVNARARFEKLQRQYAFDLLHFHQPFTAYAVLRSKTADPVKKLYTCHSLAYQEFISRNAKPRTIPGRIRYHCETRIRRFIERHALRKSDRIIVLSRFTRDLIVEAHRIDAGKIEIIPGGVDLDRFRDSADKGAIRRSLRIPGDRFVLLTVRNLVARMGLENLLHAMPDVVREIPGVLLVIGGTGALRDKLLRITSELGLQNHVRFDGFIPDARLADYYRMADLFILPTLELEGFGLVTLESLAAGVPVLGTPVGGTIEILNRLNPEYLFSNPSPGAMASRIIAKHRAYMSHPGLMRDEAKQCRAFVERHYSWQKRLDLLEALCEELRPSDTPSAGGAGGAGSRSGSRPDSGKHRLPMAFRAQA